MEIQITLEVTAQGSIVAVQCRLCGNRCMYRSGELEGEYNVTEQNHRGFEGESSTQE